MTTQELKQYIDKVLGNSIRCLLPSYWWKRIFGLVVDEVDKVKNSISTLEDGYKALEESKADADAFIMLETTELDRMEYGAVYLVRGQRDSLKVNFWEYKSPRPDVLNWTIWFSNKTSLEVTSNGVAFQWEGGTPTIDLSNLNPNNLYRLDCTLVTVGASGTTVKYVKRVARIVEYGDNAKYDTFVSETSTNAVQNKVITEKFAELSAKIDELGEGVEGPQGPVGPQGPQGNSGYTGAADELEVVNNLTDGGATAALSAEQGKVLDSKLTELSEEVGGLSERIDNLPSAESDVFKAIYGETTYEEVKAAYDSGKVVHCDYNTECYVLSRVTASGAFFSALNAPYAYRMDCYPPSQWLSRAIEIEVTSNKVTSLSSASTDTQYPSAKAVYDAIQQSGGSGGASTKRFALLYETTIEAETDRLDLITLVPNILDNKDFVIETELTAGDGTNARNMSVNFSSRNASHNLCRINGLNQKTYQTFYLVKIHIGNDSRLDSSCYVESHNNSFDNEQKADGLQGLNLFIYQDVYPIDTMYINFPFKVGDKIRIYGK